MLGGKHSDLLSSDSQSEDVARTGIGVLSPDSANHVHAWLRGPVVKASALQSQHRRGSQVRALPRSFYAACFVHIFLCLPRW